MSDDPKLLLWAEIKRLQTSQKVLADREAAMLQMIDELRTENERLREALEKIDVLAEAGRRLDEGIAACDDIRAKVRAALAKEAGQPHSAWPTGPGYRRGDTCQSADGTNWFCVEGGITAKWERGKAKEAGK